MPRRISIVSYVVLGLLSFWAYTSWGLLGRLGISSNRRIVITGCFVLSGVLVFSLFILYIMLGVVQPGRDAIAYIGSAATLFVVGVFALSITLFQTMKHRERTALSTSRDLTSRWEKLDLQLTLFLVFTPLLCSAPVFAVWNMVSVSSTGINWTAYSLNYAAAAVFHLWGTRLLINVINNHFEFLSEQVPGAEEERTNQNQYDVFISYRRAGGSEIARLVRVGLQQRGFKIFLDVDDLPSGHFDEGLLKVIRRTPNFIVILSQGALDKVEADSDWLRKEVAEALQSQKNIVPILLTDFSFSEMDSDLGELARHNAVTYHHEYYDASMDRVAEKLLCE